MRKRIPKILIYGSVIFSLLLPVILQAATVQAEDEPVTSAGEPTVVYASRSDSYAGLRDPAPRIIRNLDMIELPRKMLPNRPGDPGVPVDDPVQQGPVGEPSAAIDQSFEGVNNINGVLPPDTQGDIGPNHYIQVVNLAFAIYDRSGTLLYGPANLNTLFSGFGGACESTNDGDPIVLYDHLADRWLISQFALPNYPLGSFYQCIAISQTPDPTGGYYRYEFNWGSKLNDYPKFGVWEDGYYMSVNQFSQLLLNWAGQGVAVFERDAMLNGDTSRMIKFDLYNTDANLGGMLPADLDGTPPPAGTPNYFIQVDDNAWGYSPDQLQIWEFHTDWTNTNNSTFTKIDDIGVAAFDSDMCGGSRNCIPQPGGTNVDAISDRLMYRLQYRDFGSYQTMVVNHTVDVNGSDRAGIRWYELRDTGSGWGIHQQSTFSPDSNHRWMGSIAMNGQGDMALGYSISSSSVNPSIRVTGRLAGDTLGQMTQGESTIVNGSGYQGHSSGRWGDYSMMSVDPVDDCTFWYTTEYYTSTSSGNANWRTRVGSFTLAQCALASKTFPLLAGWNLINLPLQPATAYTAQSLLDEINSQGGDCTEVDRWLNGGWNAHIDGVSFNNFDIEMAEGYFLRCNQASDWSYQGQPLESAVSVDLSAGWTLIGIPYPDSGYLAQSLLDEINAQGGDCTEVDRWLNGGWNSHIDGQGFNNFEVTNDLGYFVRCTQASTYTPGQ